MIDPDSHLPVEVIIYKEAASGGMFGIDASYAESILDFDPVYVPSLFDNGRVQLLD